jgi:hypothetical protein
MTEATTNLKVLLIVGDGVDSELLSFLFSTRGFQVVAPTEHQLAANETLPQLPNIVFIYVELPAGVRVDIASSFTRSSRIIPSWLVALGAGTIKLRLCRIS